MRIAITVPSPSPPSGHFMFYFYKQLLQEIAGSQSQYQFFIIADNMVQGTPGFPINTEIINFPSTGKTKILSNLRRRYLLSSFLKNKKIDWLISLEGKYLRNISVPQSVFITDFNKIKWSTFSGADSIWVLSEYGKKKILNRTGIMPEKIQVINPLTSAIFHTVTIDEKEEIKKKHSDGHDFFLYNGPSLSPDEFILLLKAYSLFKNRQKSSLQFIFLSEQGNLFQKYLLNYKYRKDVKIISTLNEELPVQITTAAYAVILPGENEMHLIAAAQAMQKDVPVIAVSGSAISECLGTAVLCAGEKSPKEFGDLMMRLYTDEPFRACLIENGRNLARKFSLHHPADILRQSVERSYT